MALRGNLAAALAVAAAVCSAPTANAVRITGLVAPTSFSLDQSSGRVYISGQYGSIWMAANMSATSATMIATLSSKLATFGENGLTSVQVTPAGWAGTGSPAYLWATYSGLNSTYGNTCSADNVAGAVDGRTAVNVTGCVTYGVLSRFPINAATGAINVSAEEVALGRGAGLPMCAQFGHNGISQVLLGPDNELYVSSGAGASPSEDAIDDGRYGGNPCGTGTYPGGHFRAQDPLCLSGKIARVNRTSPFATTLIARGMNHPWRMAVKGAELHALDTGLTNQEEVNGPLPIAAGAPASNLGFPCYIGNATVAIPELHAICNATWAPSVQAAWTRPWYVLAHDGAAVISAIGYHPTQNRWYLGDYVNQVVWSVAPDGTDRRVEATGVLPVHMAYYGPEDAMLVVDVYAGRITTVNATPAASPVPNPASSASTSAASIVAALASTAVALALALAH